MIAVTSKNKMINKFDFVEEIVDEINIYDPVDYWLSKRIFKHADKKK